MTDHSDKSLKIKKTIPISQPVAQSDFYSPSWPELPPEMEDFHLYNPIGSGSTGTVFRAVQTKEYAVKIVPWQPARLRETAKHEYDTVRLFSNCETVIHAFAYYEYNSSSYILQEIGEPILDYFYENPCSLRELLQSLLDISDALSFIHSKGYSHFDVKPGNILIVKGKARLGDFSHCLRCVQGQQYTTTGTEAFMAPEVVPGAKHTGLEDIYSLGITMYALLLAGVLPFENKPDINDKEKLYIRSLFIHPALLSVIRKAAAFDPAERYQCFEDFSKDIRSFMDVYQNDLDEIVPVYLSNTRAKHLNSPTVPPFQDRFHMDEPS